MIELTKYTKDYKVSNYADTYYYSVFVLGRDLLKGIFRKRL